MRDIDDILAGMAVFDPSLRYYALTFTADKNACRVVGTQTTGSASLTPTAGSKSGSLRLSNRNS